VNRAPDDGQVECPCDIVSSVAVTEMKEITHIAIVTDLQGKQLGTSKYYFSKKLNQRLSFLIIIHRVLLLNSAQICSENLFLSKNKVSSHLCGNIEMCALLMLFVPL
jgi:hypothetical protein